MLHIVNGDTVADKLKEANVQGEILVWKEVYPHGPVFLHPSLPASRDFRAKYLEKTMGIPRTEFIQGSEWQENKLASWSRYRDIVLWFEHDLFDQTILCYLLHWFCDQKLKNTKVYLLSIGAYPGIELFRGLGQLSVEQLKGLVGTWKPIEIEQFQIGKLLWEAFTADDPQQLQQLIIQDTSALPYTHDAFNCHLSRFPSRRNGLGIVEQATLDAIVKGYRTANELFTYVGGGLHVLGMGDLQYWHILKRMSAGSHALLEIEGSDPLRKCEFSITELGQSIYNGKADWISVNGIDEWYGGVHLKGYSPRWRWDSAIYRV